MLCSGDIASKHGRCEVESGFCGGGTGPGSARNRRQRPQLPRSGQKRAARRLIQRLAGPCMTPNPRPNCLLRAKTRPKSHEPGSDSAAGKRGLNVVAAGAEYWKDRAVTELQTNLHAGVQVCLPRPCESDFRSRAKSTRHRQSGSIFKSPRSVGSRGSGQPHLLVPDYNRRGHRLGCLAGAPTSGSGRPTPARRARSVHFPRERQSFTQIRE